MGAPTTRDEEDDPPMATQRPKSSPRESRPARLGTLLRQELARLIQLELRDPRLEGLIVASVSVTPDLRLARVFYRLAILSATDAERDARKNDAQAALERASGRLKAAVTARLALRFAPELRFRYDAGQEARDRIDELLEEVKRDRH